MANIEISLGALRFSAEGEETWLTEQLQFAMGQFEHLAKLAAPMNSANANDGGTGAAANEKPVGSLASHIKEKGGESNQNQRFLAAADWLRRKGQTQLKTSLVSSTLKENQQKKLSNPSEALNQNVSKGFCEKAGSNFFITPEGLKHLGYDG